MAITSNADSKQDRELLARYEALHPEVERDVKFLAKHVVVFDAEAGEEERYTRKQFLTMLDEAEEELDEAEDEEFAPVEAPLPAQASEPRAGTRQVDVPNVAAETDQRILDEYAGMAFEVGLAERRGELSKNSARFERGELMVRLASLAQAERTPLKRLLGSVNSRMAETAAENNLADFQLITEQEATTTRRVVEAFGSSGDFRLVNAVNPLTGDPMVGDDGEPPRVDIRAVAMNKLYAVAEYASERDLDTLLSFTYRAHEKVVKKLKSVAKSQGVPITRLIKRLDRMRRDATHTVTGATIRVQLGDKEMLDKLREMAGEQPAPEVASIKTDRAWYESFWLPIKALMSDLMRNYHPEVLGEQGTEVSNVFVLERLVSQNFNPHEEEGMLNLLRALVNAEDITPQEAADFAERFEFNPGTGHWEVSPGADAEADEDGEFEDEAADDEDQEFAVEAADDEDDGFEEPADPEDEGFEAAVEA